MNFRRTTACVFKVVKSSLSGVFILCIVLYRYSLSPIMHMIAPGSGCRFQPTCSQYSISAIREHGPFRGLFLALRRLSRCHPWGGFGYDPVPPKEHTRHHSHNHFPS